MNSPYVFPVPISAASGNSGARYVIDADPMSGARFAIDANSRARSNVSGNSLARSTAGGNPGPKFAADHHHQNARLKGVKVVKPIVLGNVAWYLGRKREEDDHTHKWTVYLRPYRDHDYGMSAYLRRVQFRLHDSYPDPVRVLTAPPYSVTETGWGEFEVTVKLFFVDNCERPVARHHFLKLFHRDADGSVRLGPEPVRSESYDELVFVEPSLRLHALLTSPRTTGKPVTVSLVGDHEAKKVEALEKILDAKVKVKAEVAELRSRLALVKEEIVKLRAEVAAQ